LLPLRGVFAPIVTPFDPSDGELDLPWLAEHVAYLRDHGCTGIIACGTNGEAASLSVAERERVTEAALEAADTMPVIVGTGATALPDAITLTRHAFVSGADAVLIMPPFYFRNAPAAGVAEWFRRLFDEAVPPDGRVLFYHIPQTTGVPISDELLALLYDSHPEVIFGVKDSTGDFTQLQHFRTVHPQLAYFAGNDHRVADACLAGGAGSITAGANVFPDLVAAVQQAAWRGRNPEVAQETLSAARRLLDTFPLQPATKRALVHVAGLAPTAVRPPQVELSREQDAQLRAALANALPSWRKQP
jgi:4-hydroxy-tetrahydrodipicolinate synthase